MNTHCARWWKDTVQGRWRGLNFNSTLTACFKKKKKKAELWVSQLGGRAAKRKINLLNKTKNDSDHLKAILDSSKKKKIQSRLSINKSVATFLQNFFLYFPLSKWNVQWVDLKSCSVLSNKWTWICQCFIKLIVVRILAIQKWNVSWLALKG